MVKVTYTKKQLEAFTVKELRTIEYSNGIGKVSKSELIAGMLKNQKAAVKAQKAKDAEEKAKAEIKKDSQPAEVKAEVEADTTPDEPVEEKVKEEVVAPQSEKPLFHRPIKRRNPMTFR